MSQPIEVYFNRAGSIKLRKPYDDGDVATIIVSASDVEDFILQLARASNYSSSVISAMQVAIEEAGSPSK